MFNDLVTAVGDQLARWLPFLDTFSPLARVGVVLLAALLLFVAVEVPYLLWSAHRDARRAAEALAAEEQEQRQRRDAAVEALKSIVPDSLVTELSVREGVRRANAAVLSTITDDFKRFSGVITDILDKDIVTRTADYLTGKWDGKRRVEFCLRYSAQLAVLLTPSHLREIAAEADMLTRDVTVDGIGEKGDGLYALLRTDVPLTLSEWTEAIPLLRAELDSPRAVIHKRVDSHTVLLELRDRDRRYEQHELPYSDDTPPVEAGTTK